MFKNKPWIRMIGDEVEGGGSQEEPQEDPAPKDEGGDEDGSKGSPNDNSDDDDEDLDGDWDPERARRKIRKANQEAKTQRERAKAAEEKAKGDADFKSRAEAAEAKLLRRDVADELGLPAKLADRLKGSTKEELAADAEELLKLVSPSKPGGGKPSPKLKGQGGTKPGEDPEMSAADIVKAATKRR